MKLSEILKDWPEKKEYQSTMVNPADVIYNTALESCDREIDREALVKVIQQKVTKSDINHIVDVVISTMPTWLKPTERKGVE